MPRPIYVEIRIAVPFDALWTHTQDPALHERWDLRFTQIRYLPRAGEDQPQQFLYATRIGLGLRIAGTGESVGRHDTPTESTSALRFGSDDRRSLIREGSGYWKYVRGGEGIRFLTRYDYTTRFGPVGAAFDRIVFRPVLGWATAWSFDRLRLWLERGVDPALSAQRALVHSICRSALAFIWIWHGLVPKVLARHPGEVEPLEAAGLFTGREVQVVVAVGVIEILFGAAHLVLWRMRSLYLADLVVFSGLGLGAIATLPHLALAPFNPVSFTMILLALALVGWLACRDLPSARRCLRRPPEGRR